MHIFEFAFYVTASIYALFYQPILLLYFTAIVVGYVLISICYPRAQSISTRRKFALATWPRPSQGIIYNQISVKVDKLLNYLDILPEKDRPTITHYVIKACGQILRHSPDLNGKLIFGKFVPYDSCDVCCLVNIDEGNDVGMMLVKDVPNKSVYQIGQMIRNKSKGMKKKGGDQTHAQRMNLLHYLPSFLIGIVYKLSIFATSHLGVNLTSMGLVRDELGSMIVTSVGTFGYTNAYTSFFDTTGQWILLTVNAVHERVELVDGVAKSIKVMNVNCCIDHRYLHSGGRGRNLTSMFLQVFENPQRFTFSSGSNKTQ